MSAVDPLDAGKSPCRVRIDTSVPNSYFYAWAVRDCDIFSLAVPSFRRWRHCLRRRDLMDYGSWRPALCLDCLCCSHFAWYVCTYCSGTAPHFKPSITPLRSALDFVLQGFTSPCVAWWTFGTPGILITCQSIALDSFSLALLTQSVLWAACCFLSATQCLCACERRKRACMLSYFPLFHYCA